MNKVSLVGRLATDVDARQTQTGKAVSRFRLAVNRRSRDDGADFIGCVAWNKTAELIEKYVHKGDRVGVVGRIQTGSYEKDGQKIYTTDVVVEEIEFLEKKGQSESDKTDSQKEEWVNTDDVGELPF